MIKEEPAPIAPPCASCEIESATFACITDYCKDCCIRYNQRENSMACYVHNRPPLTNGRNKKKEGWLMLKNANAGETRKMWTKEKIFKTIQEQYATPVVVKKDPMVIKTSELAFNKYKPAWAIHVDSLEFL